MRYHCVVTATGRWMATGQYYTCRSLQVWTGTDWKTVSRKTEYEPGR